ncbi:MAG: translation elongation factor 4 [Candidatus Pacebacteria bacterium]|nr:translation elongation factor 4 [Candidatus Paceibacterota bacterium]MCD8507797.1 translation elongation factor 4 [Candidatus Paceibacterota bacterium]MCD8527890.1 translation elongation factor 4 [Candidatus Paceibacterota bacterium]MCD8563558.1 translation elongation factor 4 [Candidatus Paceibacterota bacterium]
MNEHIRNFSIIAHIDHGKSTLADRMLEVTHTVEQRKMQNQILDSMELERERGITIKMQPVRMNYTVDGIVYTLNLIDTPGHIDFSYEVSRALKAVEGSILLVDATQGVQAQTFTTLDMARAQGLVIIPVVTKVDSPLARPDEVKLEIAEILDVDPDTILEVSGKTGEGVPELLEHIVRTLPAPHQERQGLLQGLLFDFEYSNHKGVIVYTRIMQGSVKKGDQLVFAISQKKFHALEVGVLSPAPTPTGVLNAGEIGYIVTGVKEAGVAHVGDTVTHHKQSAEPLPGYQKPDPVVWASVYPEDADDFDALRSALGRLQLSDSSFSYEEETSGILGRGFRSGFLGMLHLEIITERLRREFHLDLVVTTPSVTYEVDTKRGQTITVYSPPLFPDHGDVAAVREPWVNMRIITPPEYLGDIGQLLFSHEADTTATHNFGDGRTELVVEIPLRELMRNFFDELKSISSGYASISYTLGALRPADVVRLDILVAGDPVPAFTRIVSRKRAQEEGEQVVEKLHTVLPRQMFVVKIQAEAQGRIISSRTIKALRKDVTGYLYGGDITRKMKLREKQKKGKKRMAAQGKVHIPQDVFMKMMKK